jgi:hypothetical protein
MAPQALSDTDLERVFAALTSEISGGAFPITAAGQLFRAAGFTSTGLQYWQPLIRQVDEQFRQMSGEERLRSVRILAERLVNHPRSQDVRDSVKTLLASHGFQYIDGTFVRIGLFDERELQFLPQAAVGEISTALDRLINGDLDGAVSAVSGTVETAVAALVANIDRNASFQEKAKAGLDAAGRLAALEAQLTAIGWPPERARMLVHNLRGMLNQGSFVMQILRSDMGDVHGAKKALEPVVYDMLKLASMLLSFMKPPEEPDRGQRPAWLS